METAPAKLCSVYADMSMMNGAVGFCALAIVDGRSVVACGDITDIATGVAAEFEALRRGLLLCPKDSERVIAHSDIDDLQRIMNGGGVSWADHSISKLISDLKSLGGQFKDIKWRTVHRGGSVHYARCHRQARLAAKAASDRRRPQVSLSALRKWADL